ncbi:MAG TPA: hypothetical protein DEH78_01755 [Solibacterales bacterium]|nr:hypothetical protein [Bryobacterales bacterium]
MSKVLLGLALGAVLGVFDGLTSWFTPEVRDQLASIIMGSTFKGLLTGAMAGFYARKVNSVGKGCLFGLIVGAFWSWLVAYLQGKYYFEIMLPGSILGLVVGFATQRLGGAKAGARAPQRA